MLCVLHPVFDKLCVSSHRKDFPYGKLPFLALCMPEGLRYSSCSGTRLINCIEVNFLFLW